MVIKNLHVMAFFSLFLLCLGGNLASVHAQDTQASVLAVKDNSTALTQVKDDAEQLRGQIDRIQNAISMQEKKTGEELEKLEEIIATQNGIIEGLKADLKSLVDKPLTNGTTFEVWSGILLGCVAIMVTVLSVMLAFFQYTGIKNAKEESLREARRVANNITPRVAEQKLLEHVKEGGFNKIIYDAVDKIALSNIVDPENYNEGDTDE